MALNWKIVLKWRDIYTESLNVMSLMSGLKIEGRGGVFYLGDHYID